MKYTIEVCSPKNHGLFWALTGTKLRGHWSHRVSAGVTVHDALAAIHRAAPEIPGICLEVDVTERVARQYDPLNETDEGRAIWRAIEPLLKGSPFGEMRRWDLWERPNLTNDELKTWLHHMRYAVDNGWAVLVAGSPQLPTLDAIAQMPGGRLTQLHDSNPRERGKIVDVVRSGQKTTRAKGGEPPGSATNEKQP